ncbi:MAG: NAD+ kinase [Acidobacteriota bacterium]
MAVYEKIVVVTRKTRLAELIERFNSRAQAKFYIEHAGGDFNDYVQEDDAYRRTITALHHSLNLGLKLQFIDRSYLPTFLFTEKDLIVTVGQDGLVANTAKYVASQPIVAINPEPTRFDGILLPFQCPQAQTAVSRVVQGKARMRTVTLAEASLNDGQRLLAFNDLFVGARTHVSARYRIKFRNRTESQSSSGILISTGAGSTGWLSSVFKMVAGVAAFTGGKSGEEIRLKWEDSRLIFVVREPFASKSSYTEMVAGIVLTDEELILESFMPSGGVIFSDGIEADYLAFNSGTVAKIHTAREQARLVVS